MAEPDFQLTAGDRWPPLTATLRDGAGAAIPLTAVQSVRFHMRPLVGGGAALDGVATVVDPAAGTVRYDWQAGDTDAAGEYDADFRIVFASGAPATVPNRERIRVLITGRLA